MSYRQRHLMAQKRESELRSAEADRGAASTSTAAPRSVGYASAQSTAAPSCGRARSTSLVDQRTQGDGTGRALRESVGPRRKVTRASAAKEGDTYIAGDLQRELMLLASQLRRLAPGYVGEAVAALKGQVEHITERVRRAAAGSHAASSAPSLTGDDVSSPGSSRQGLPAPRWVTTKMPSEVSSDNPYSRLMALKIMGVVPNYEDIRDKRVAVVGVGGVGSVAAEMLTRCGVGELLLYDCDRVEMANMNRLFFRPEHVGLPKTRAAQDVLQSINPDVAVTSYYMDVTTVEGASRLEATLSSRGGVVDGGDALSDGQAVDLVLCCVDNYTARITVNRACLRLGLPWLESGVSEDALSGHVQHMLPGRTACYECMPPLAVATGMDESKIRREGVCAASLPTTMGIIAGVLAQNALKFLLGFGSVASCWTYASLSDFSSHVECRPNPECRSEECRAAQAREAAKGGSKNRGAGVGAAPSQNQGAAEAPLHTSNVWGIEVLEGADAGKDVPDAGPSTRGGGVGSPGRPLAETWGREPTLRTSGEQGAPAAGSPGTRRQKQAFWESVVSTSIDGVFQTDSASSAVPARPAASQEPPQDSIQDLIRKLQDIQR